MFNLADVSSLGISQPIIVIAIFILTYVLIIGVELLGPIGRKEKTIAAIFGVALLRFFGIMSGEDIIGSVDLEVIGLLFGMMVLVGGLQESGFFRYLGLYIADLCKYEPSSTVLLFSVVTAIMSAFLANVTVVLFMVPVIIEVMNLLGLSPVLYVILIIIIANIGGTATLVGIPSNVMIGTAGGLPFSDFILNVGPISLVVFLCAILYIMFKHMRHTNPLDTKTINDLQLRARRERADAITDRGLCKYAIITFIAVMMLLTVHERFALSPSTVALWGATFLLFFGGPKMPDVLRNVEWSLLIFLSCLFAIVKAFVNTGIIDTIAYELSLAVKSELVAVLAIF